MKNEVRKVFANRYDDNMRRILRRYYYQNKSWYRLLDNMFFEKMSVHFYRRNIHTSLLMSEQNHEID